MRFPVFTMRGLLIAIACVAIPFSLWNRTRAFRAFAAQNHFAAIDNGYKAAAIQRPVLPGWQSNGQTLSDAIAKAPLQMDGTTIRLAAPFWNASMHHAELRDIYLNAAYSPWIRMPNLPSTPAKTPPLKTDLAATKWWNETILPYVTENPSLMVPHPDIAKTDPKNNEHNRRLLTQKRFLELQWRLCFHRGLVSHDEQHAR